MSFRILLFLFTASLLASCSAEKLYLCMKYELPEIILPEWVIEQGVPCINRMMEISEKAGLGLKG